MCSYTVMFSKMKLLQQSLIIILVRLQHTARHTHTNTCNTSYSLLRSVCYFFFFFCFLHLFYCFALCCWYSFVPISSSTFFAICFSAESLHTDGWAFALSSAASCVKASNIQPTAERAHNFFFGHPLKNPRRVRAYSMTRKTDRF